MGRVMEQAAAPGKGDPARPGAPPRALIVAGPTCSGKSAMAMALALRHRGTVINADSMQVYRELRILTARPTPEDEAAVPHTLYGVRPAAEPGSAAWWRGAAVQAMEQARDAGRLLILCGGTGMYLAALCQGLSDIPPVADAIRTEARGLLVRDGAEALHARLATVDPRTAATLSPGDGQRVARAWEVWRQTGRGLVEWQGDGRPGQGGLEGVRMILLLPDRAELRAAIARRFRAMLDAGALTEAAALAAQGLDPALPAMRAHGMPELLAVLHGELTVDEAERRAVLATGQYTKRQATWFRHRAPVSNQHTHMIHARFAGPKQFSESQWASIDGFVRNEERGEA